MFRQAVLAPRRLEDALVCSDQSRPPVNFNALFGLTHFDMASNEVVGYGIAVGIDRDVSLHIHQALMEKVDRSHPDRQRLQVGLFNGKQLARTGLEIIAELRVDLIAPFARLTICIFPVLESTAGQEIRVDIPEASLHAGRAIGVSFLMSAEVEAIPLREGRHFRHWHHVAACALQHHDVGVIDHASFASSLKILQSVGEKHFAVETSESGEKFEEQQSRIAADQRSSLNGPQLATDLGTMW